MEGSIRGVGQTPGHRLTPGTKVIVRYAGQQRMYIAGVVGNDDADEKYSDQHPFKSDKKDHVNPVARAFEQEWKQFQVDTPYKINPANSRKVNTTPSTPKEKKDPVRTSTTEPPEPKRLGNARGVESVTGFMPLSIAGFPRIKGSLLNATKAIQQLLGKKGEIIPNELSMILELQQKAKSGGIYKQTTTVGGIGNITQAIAGIMSLVNKIKGNDPKKKETDEELSELELFLRALYKEMTGQVATDENGNETPQYKIWKKEMLQLLQKQWNEDNGTGVS